MSSSNGFVPSAPPSPVKAASSLHALASRGILTRRTRTVDAEPESMEQYARSTYPLSSFLRPASHAAPPKALAPPMVVRSEGASLPKAESVDDFDGRMWHASAPPLISRSPPPRRQYASSKRTAHQVSPLGFDQAWHEAEDYEEEDPKPRSRKRAAAPESSTRRLSNRLSSKPPEFLRLASPKRKSAQKAVEHTLSEMTPTMQTPLDAYASGRILPTPSPILDQPLPLSQDEQVEIAQGVMDPPGSASEPTDGSISLSSASELVAPTPIDP